MGYDNHTRPSIVVSITGRYSIPYNHSVKDVAKDLVSSMVMLDDDMIEKYQMTVYKDSDVPKQRKTICRFLNDDFIVFGNHSIRNGTKDIVNNMEMKRNSLEEKFQMDVYKDSDKIKSRYAICNKVEDMTPPKTTSIKNTVKDFVSCMIYSDTMSADEITHLYYGDELMWEQIYNFRLKWGNSENPYYADAIAYESDDGITFTNVTRNWQKEPFGLHDGWNYIYNLNMHSFSIYDENGLLRYYANTIELGMLRIDYDVFESHQFVVVFVEHFIGSTWKYECKPNKERLTLFEEEHIKHDVGNVKADKNYARILNAEIPTMLTLESNIKIKSIPKANILRSHEIIRKRLGDYSVYGIFYDNIGMVTKNRKSRKSNIYNEIMLLWSLVYLTASFRDKTTIEPWMLYDVWKYIKWYKPVYIEERIFDVMPNWG